ncbi:MAG: LD-carboxypeptidase [Rickettsiaceae bacterium]|nr:MAG: LD-carboxypeptidase [Rickettsiaceae bacterium]
MKKIIVFYMLLISSVGSVDASVEKNLRPLEFFRHQLIDVVAPASGCDLKFIKKLQETPGFNLRLSARCIQGPTTMFHAASDEIRFECLKDAITNDSSNIIWSLKGGYGSAKIIPKLSLLPKPDKEKFFIGYSDITALHLFMTQNWGWKTIHGPILGEFLSEKKSKENFIKIANIVSGKVDKSTIEGIIPINSPAADNRSIKGTITGGNLTIIQNSIGTNWQIVTNNKILFLEDINIQPYQLDRALLHLKQAQLLNDVKAIIFGEFYNCKLEVDIDKVIEDFANNIQIPVYRSMKFGHGIINEPIIYNATSEIIRNSKNNYQLVTKLK